MKRCFLLFVILLLVSSCKKHEEDLPVFAKSDIPATKNSYWVYRYQDFTNNYESQHTLKIADVITQNSDTQIISYQLFESTYLIDSAIGILTSNSYTYKSVTNNDTQFGDYSLQLPFTLAGKWTNANATDTLQVLLFANAYNAFKNVFNLHAYRRDAQITITEDIYLSQKTGVISKSLYRESGDITDRNQTYSLIEYHIEP